METWGNRRVNINGVTFEMTEDLIVKVASLSTKGILWSKQLQVVDEANLRNFFHPLEEPMHIQGRLSSDALPKPWDVVCNTIMRYITLEDVFKFYIIIIFPS
jgi:hypothetical protein